MPTFFGYFSTLQTNNNPNGFWNISHASVKYMVDRFGMKWTDLRKHMVAAFISTLRDPDIIDSVKQKTHQLIPLRTGHLMDAIFKSMRMIRSSWYNSHFFADFSYEWPLDRPIFIRNPKHTPSDQGYGDWGTVRLTEPIPISRVDVDHVTPFGNALYNLNDPQAQSNLPPDIQRIGILEIEDDYATMFNQILITVQIRGGGLLYGFPGGLIGPAQEGDILRTNIMPVNPVAAGKVRVFNQ